MDVPIWLEGVLYVGGGALLSLLGLAFMRRFVPHHVLSPHNDVAGFIYATIAVTYAVILGFVTVSVWEQFESARSNADYEANAVADLFRLSAWLPEAKQTEVRGALTAYARSVVDDEWNTMDSDGGPSEATEAALERVWSLYQTASDGSGTDSVAYEDSMDRLQDVGNARRLRLLESREGIPGVLWIALIAGGVITVAFSFGFGVERPQAHGAMVMTLAASVALLLFLISALNHAFHGDVRVQPDGMELILRQFGTA